MATMPNLDAAIYTHLNTDSAITGLATPPTQVVKGGAVGADYPYIVFNPPIGGPTNLQDHNDWDAVFRVEAISDDSSDASALARAIYEAVHKVALTVSGWTSLKMRCEGQTYLPEYTENDSKLVHRYVWDVRFRASED